MPSATSIQQLLVSAWQLSQHGLHSAARAHILSDTALFELWTCTRAISRQWCQRLSKSPNASQSSDSAGDISSAYEILATDLTLRVYATVALDRESAGTIQSVRPVFDHVIQQLSHPRRKVLDLVSTQVSTDNRIDLFRRRCERWTDLLIGPWIVKSGMTAYAFDPRRAWDYGEDSAMSPGSIWRESLLAPSFRSAFGGVETEALLTGEAWGMILHQLNLATGMDYGLPLPGIELNNFNSSSTHEIEPLPGAMSMPKTQQHTTSLEDCLRRIQTP